MAVAPYLTDLPVPRSPTRKLANPPQDLDAPLHVAARKKIHAYRAQFAHNRNKTLIPAITSTVIFTYALRVSASPLSTGPPRDHGALHRHRHASATTLRFISLSPRAAFYNGLTSKVGLAAAKTAAMRINVNIDGCGGVVAPSVHSSRAPLLLPNLLAHNLPLPRAAQ